MPRLEPVSEVPGDLAALIAGVEARMGFVPASLRLMAHRPDVLRAFLGLGAAVMAPSQTVPPGLKQMIAYVASLAAGCRYCQAHTAHQAHGQGVDAQKVADLWAFETSPLFSDSERAALRLAMLAAQSPNAVEDADAAAVLAEFGAEGLAEITAVIAFFGFLNRWNDTLATPLEDAPRAFAVADLGASGWVVGKHAQDRRG